MSSKSVRYGFGITLVLTASLVAFLSLGLTSGANTAKDAIDLSPTRLFSLTDVTETSPWKSILVGEMRATSKGLWFLVSSKEQKGRFAILAVGHDGRLQSMIDLSDAISAGGLSITSRGVATIVVKQKEVFLREYDATSALLAETRLPCGSTDSLINVGGSPAVFCSDGTITQYGNVDSPTRRNSWARRGAIVQPLSASLLAIIDQTTAQVLLNDINANSVSVAPARAPEIERALAYTATQREAAKQALPPNAPPLGGPVIAMDTAADPSGWYMLVWPYHKDLGPAVVKFDADGKLLARFRCRVPDSDAQLHRIDVHDGGLVLSSTKGEIFRYAM